MICTRALDHRYRNGSVPELPFQAARSRSLMSRDLLNLSSRSRSAIKRASWGSVAARSAVPSAITPSHRFTQSMVRLVTLGFARRTICQNSS